MIRPFAPPQRGSGRGYGMLVLAYSLLAAAWLFANPPGAAPDEPAHYVRAIGVGRGDFIGRPAPYQGPQPYTAPWAVLHARQLQWLDRNTRAVDVPAGLTPDSFGCNAFQPALSAGCLDEHRAAPAQTVVGEYSPYAYVLPGLLMRAADDPVTALLLGRVASGLPALLFLISAIWLLWPRQRTGIAMLGLVVALTPMVMFLLPQLSGSGPELGAGICLLAGTLRLARAPRHPVGVWVIVAASALVLAAGRPLGPVWVLLDGALLVVMLGLRGAVRLLRESRGAGAWALAAAALGTALNIAWVAFAQVHSPEASGPSVIQLLLSVMDLQRIAGEAIGSFGWLDTPMPSVAHTVWLALVAGLAAAAFALGTRRQRNTLLLLIGVVFALTVGITDVLIRPTGFGVQARQVMPALMAVPLYAGEVIFAQRARVAALDRRAVVLPVLTMIGALQALGWYVNAHRQAVGVAGPWLFWGREEWSPPLGWGPWLLAVALAWAALVAFGVLAWKGKSELAADAPALGRAA